MKKLSTLLTFMICIYAGSAIRSQVTAIPDENFEQALIDLNIDSDGNINGQVATADISSLTSLDVSARNIGSLVGIEDFTNLTALICQENVLTSLNIEANADLVNLNCSKNLLENLSVRQNTQLKSLNCAENLISEIFVADNLELEQLDTNDNRLVTLNVQSNQKLLSLDCSHNMIQKVNVKSNRILQYLDIASNQISEIDLFDNVLLEYLDVSDNPLAELALFNLMSLKEFHGSNNDLLTRIDFAGNFRLEYISCHDNEALSLLDIRGAKALQYLNCSNNLLADLDTSQNELLQSLYCQGNDLTLLDLSFNPNLAFLKCTDNKLEALDLKNEQNHLMTGGFTDYEGTLQYMQGMDASNNPGLRCIQVDDEENALAGSAPYDSWLKDAIAIYAEDCESALAIEEHIPDDSCKVFPNPSSHILRIESDLHMIDQVTIYSIQGSLVLKVNSNFHSIPLDSLESGLYILHIQLENQSLTRRLIKV